MATDSFVRHPDITQKNLHVGSYAGKVGSYLCYVSRIVVHVGSIVVHIGSIYVYVGSLIAHVGMNQGRVKYGLITLVLL